MWSVLCFDQAGNSKIMILKLRSSWITVIFFEIADAHQTYSCKGSSQCIDPHLASIMATDFLILPNKLQVLNAISILLGLVIFPYLHVCFSLIYMYVYISLSSLMIWPVQCIFPLLCVLLSFNHLLKRMPWCLINRMPLLWFIYAFFFSFYGLMRQMPWKLKTISWSCLHLSSDTHATCLLFLGSTWPSICNCSLWVIGTQIRNGWCGAISWMSKTSWLNTTKYQVCHTHFTPGE